MFFTTTTENTNFVVGLSILIIGLILACIFFTWHFMAKKNSSKRGDFAKKNRESEGVWEFTKKNFPIFTALFCLVLAFTGLMMLIS
ncbi:hypothetical protein [[Acholeplasma] multilocale]|uniref:hypothetical protein n=1 Tax=[Acholeplasma] multilocale TaxID=264638 RepID=UPI000556B30B|nr:hypothetical protein [[Acholeplasma] multilocale]